MANDVAKRNPRPAEKLEKNAPRLALDLGEDDVPSVSPSGQWGRIFQASANIGVWEELLCQLAFIGKEGERTSESAANFTLGFVDAMEPRDTAELLLLTQMAVTHQAVLMMARRANRAKTIQQADSAERALNKTARTYAAQMETLKRYRSKGQQTVRVERVTVESGGQAVVGNVDVTPKT